MPAVVSVINYKGGVGKTTLTANLAGALTLRGERVLLIDLDPQSNLTFSFYSVDFWKEHLAAHSIKRWYDAFLDEDHEQSLQELITLPEKANLRLRQLGATGKLGLIPSHLELINVDGELAVKLLSPRQIRSSYLRVMSRLATGLAGLPEGDWDWVLVDCPPNFNIVTKTALVASAWYLVPAKPDYLSTLGVEQLQRHVWELVNEYNGHAAQAADPRWAPIDPQLLGVVFTMAGLRAGDYIGAQKEYVNQVARLGVPVFKGPLRESKTSYTEAPAHGIPVVLERPGSDTQRELRAELEQIAGEFLARAAGGERRG